MKFKSIAYKIFLGILVLSIGFLSFMWIVVDRMYTNVLRDKEVQYNITVSNKTKEQFVFIIDLMERTLNSLEQNKSLKQLMESPFLPGESETMDSPEDLEKWNNNIDSAVTLLDNTLELQSFIHSIHIIGVNDLHLSTSNAPLDAEGLKFYDEYLEQAKNSDSKDGFWSGLHNANTRPSYAVKVLSYVKPYYQRYTRKLLGVTVINFDYEVTQRMFLASSIQLNDRAIIANSEGEILFSYPHFVEFNSILEDYPQLLERESIQFNGKVFGKDNLIVSESISNSDLKIIRLIPANSMTTDLNQIVITTRWILVLCIIVSLFYGLWLTKTITRPLKTLTEACSRIENNDLSVRVKIHTPDEFGHLGNTFNLMMEQLNKHFDKELADQRRKSEIQFQLLQAQINPHFLYNTLDSIKWMAVMQNVNNIAEMCTALINLLKYNLHQAQVSTTLREELQSIQNYVTIQKFRYGDTFTFSIEAEEKTLDCHVLRFILQPLVENSIIHGFDDIDSNYKIRIVSFFTQDNLHIQIIDNGSGMNQEEQNRLNTGNKKTKKRFNNIGSQNIQERIRLYFGKNYGLSYTSKPNIETIAELILPVLYQDITDIPNESLDSSNQ